MDTTTTDNAVDAAAERTLSTVDRVAQSAHEAIDRLASKAGPAVERLRGSTTHTAETLRAKADAFGAIEEEWVENARGYVRENPLTALAIGVLAGVVLSKIASSR
ncbi:hypothetical protein GPROT2_03611 [Gammaproteobacteria bacterium]|nr:hypothetical protein GPROT2_03611 [Gammaproteobacteria bacterium]